jgi:hypothetical protein
MNCTGFFRPSGALPLCGVNPGLTPGANIEQALRANIELGLARPPTAADPFRHLGPPGQLGDHSFS